MDSFSPIREVRQRAREPKSRVKESVEQKQKDRKRREEYDKGRIETRRETEHSKSFIEKRYEKEIG